MLGIIFAIAALVCFVFGDFYIQKTARLVGVWRSLFFIEFVATLVLFPFVWEELTTIQTNQSGLLLLSLTSIVILFAALFEMQGLKDGKLAVIEPILGLEIPLTVGLGVVLWNEQLTGMQSISIFAIFIGIILAVTKQKFHSYKRLMFEKGAIIAGTGAVTMALANFLVGVSSQEVSPFMAIWFTSAFLSAVALLRFIIKGELFGIITDLKKHFSTIFAESFFDNGAWLFYALAMSLISISIATAIVEGYIVFTILLGFLINKEKVKKHQLWGIGISIIGTTILSFFAG